VYLGWKNPQKPAFELPVTLKGGKKEEQDRPGGKHYKD
jgi:hypothetical protein